MDSSVNVITIICALCYFLYYFATSKYDYWKKKGVKGPKPIPLLGNTSEIIFRKESIGRTLEKIYRQFPDEKCIGFYSARRPVLIVKDLDLIKQVLIKDFDYFPNRGMDNKTETFHQNLVSAEDDLWRVLRQKLTPVFSSGKLRNMFYLIEKCANNFDKYIEYLIDNKVEHEIRALTGKYTMSAIGNCAFGIDVDTFDDENNIYSKMGNRIFDNDVSYQILRLFNSIFPGILEKLKISTDKKDVVEFYTNLVNNLLKEREGKEKVRHDFMDLLIELREQGTVKGSSKHAELFIEMTDILIAAQAVVFYAAGFETSSGAMAFMLYEMALNEDIQNKAIQEIDDIYEKYGDITYDSIKEMVYVQMIMSEALRKYPVIELLPRKCQDDYTLPGEKFTIEKGTLVLVPLSAIHHDPKIHPEPNKFIPERFEKESKQKMHPCAYIPFGEGPRICIGMRFSRVQTLVGIAKILRKYRFKKSAKMVGELKFNPTSTSLQTLDGIWLDFEKRLNHKFTTRI